MTSELTLLQKPTDESAAIDALSGDFDTFANAPATPQHSKVGHLLLITCKIVFHYLVKVLFAVAQFRFRVILFGMCCQNLMIVLLL